MAIERTKDQAVANEMDCQIYREIGKAHDALKRGDRRWMKVIDALRAVRPHVRALMSKKDVEETV